MAIQTEPVIRQKMLELVQVLSLADQIWLTEQLNRLSEEQEEEPSAVAVKGRELQVSDEVWHQSNIRTYNDPTARRIILQPIEDGWWLAEVPSLPGCLSQGETRQAALENVQEAIELYIECLREDGEPIPADVEVMRKT